ncbi:DUF2231 domain-containing protein [Niabella soli]|uniref:DUF2231 domain-containing protein n=1 Tax=Niabella soli TaxID=446683 RepID=UPI00030F19C1|nr:DUF2231 domain-containing protein [Niabella soli]
MMEERSRAQAIIFNACIFLNCLLVFLLFFGSELRLPAFLQVFGRAHPLVLHFPIVLLLLAFGSELIVASSRAAVPKNTANWLLLSAAFTTVITALMGLFLSKEPGYGGDEVTTHKWLGIACSLLAFGWYGLKDQVRRNKAITTVTGIGVAAVLLVAGHIGGNITHGEDFLFSPVLAKSETPQVPFEDAIVYTHLIQPIFEKKCMSCHNSSKAKGELVMETQQLLLKGGKDGKLWDTTAAGFGLLMQRIHLPLESKEHMPPQGKPQLTDEEARILYLWIKAGSSFTQKLATLPDSDSLKMIARSFFKSKDEEQYTFAAADENTVKKLSNSYRVVAPIATGSPALDVSFFSAAQFKGEQLKELEKVKDNIVSLQLSKMPVTDEDLKAIGSFSNLRALNLSFTKVKGDGIKYLAGLQHLKQLSLSGTGITTGGLQPLAKLKTLIAIEVWNTAITDKDLTSLKSNFPKAAFDIGYKGDTVIAKLSTPIITAANDKQIFSNTSLITIKSPVKAAIIRYTTDGNPPDSLKSPGYEKPFIIGKSAVIHARAFLKGWISSDTATAGFYKSGIKVDSVFLITRPNPRYIKNAMDGKAFIDEALGGVNFGTPEWVGYQDSVLEIYLFFKQPVKVSALTLNGLVATGSDIFPPDVLQVWGGTTTQSLQLLSQTRPTQPSANQPAYLADFTGSFQPRQVSLIKLVAKPVRLPAWHPRKGKKGWVFCDEVLVN